MKFKVAMSFAGSGADINDNGLVVGYVGNTTAAQKAFVAVGESITVLPISAYNSQALAIGPDNEVVGTATTPDRYGVFGWKHENNQLTVIPGLGGTVVMPRDTNGSVIVGQASLANRAGRAFRHENGKTEDLGTLGGPASVAQAVNAFGSVAGQSRINASSMIMRPFLYKDGAMSSFGAPGSGSAWCYGLNDSNVGVGQDGGSAVMFRGNETIVLSGGQGSAFAINNAGFVVGQVGNPGTAMLWANGQAINLNDATSDLGGVSLMSAKSINNHNQIVAVGFKGSVMTTVVLEPVA